jgi:hypothetical protein
MTKKKSKEINESTEPRFEVKKRQPKEKPNFFQNIPSFAHPLAEILNFPTGKTPETDSDTQTSDRDAPRKEITAQPEVKTLDAQKDKSVDTQNHDFLDTQKIKALDTQTFEPDALKAQKTGHPENKSTGAWAPAEINNAPRKIKSSGAQAPGKSKAVHSKNEEWRKYEGSRSSVRVNLHIDKEIDKKVRQYCYIDADPKVELREFYERAAVHLLEFLDTQNIGSLSAETPLDDGRLMMMYKSKPFIINLYLRYNSVFNELAARDGKKWSARWTQRDDQAAIRYNEISPAIVELGILQTQVQKGFGSSRIQTFKYYSDEIENVLTSGVSDEMLETILNYHRQIWAKQTGREVDLSFLEK